MNFLVKFVKDWMNDQMIAPDQFDYLCIESSFKIEDSISILAFFKITTDSIHIVEIISFVNGFLNHMPLNCIWTSVNPILVIRTAEQINDLTAEFNKH